MDDTLRYLFDLNGYVVLKNVLSPERVSAAITKLEALEQETDDTLPGAAHFQGSKSANNHRIWSLLDCDPLFDALIDIPAVIDVIAGTSGGNFRLNHTYSISRNAIGSFTGFHMGAIPMHQNHTYHVRGGQIFSNLTKAIFTLTKQTAADGCFAVVPGSHKSDFPHNNASHPDDVVGIQPIETEPGDCIIFTEALRHGSTVLQSGKQRHTLYYCYSHSWMADWDPTCAGVSDAVLDRLTDTQRQILALAGGCGQRSEYWALQPN